MSPKRPAAVALAIALAAAPLHARTLTVDDDGPAEYRLIQAAIDAAAAGDLVSVAPGTYLENIRARNGVAVIGAGAALSFIDGGGAGPAARLTDCGAGTVLEGFRLTGGLAGTGGGVRIEGGAPVVRFNEIIGNRAVAGGAYQYGYGGGIAVLRSGALITDNVLSGNEADFGGGIHVDGGAARITRNLITGNTAGAGGGLDAYITTAASLLIAANTVQANTAQFGGGLELAGPGAPAVTNNLILGNTAAFGGGGTGFGGGLDGYYSGARVINNTVAGNLARTGGGAAILAEGVPRIVNGIFFDNDATSAGGALYLEAPGAVVRANLFHQNGGGTCGGPSAAALCAETSNLEADPLFVNPAAADLRVRAGSPAIDSAEAGAGGAPPDDRLGQRRPLDGDRDGAAAPDRGAYEYDRNAVPGLRFETAGRLAWEAVTGAERYHVYSGTLSAVRRDLPDLCRDADDGDPADRIFAEPPDPQEGQAVAYLVTAVIAAREQSAGFDARGLERTLPAPCP